jgi:hypothetical protein
VRRTAATADAGQRAGSAAAAAAAADDVQPLAAAAAAAGARTRRRKREQASSVGSLCNELIGLLHSTMRLDEQKPLDADKEAAFLETGGELLLQLTELNVNPVEFPADGGPAVTGSRTGATNTAPRQQAVTGRPKKAKKAKK